MATVIVPVEKDCIVQAGVRYCEDKPLTPEELGYGLLALVILGLIGWAWFAGLFLVSDNDYPVWLYVILTVAVPLTIVAFMLIR